MELPECYIDHTGIEKGDWLMFFKEGRLKIGEVIHIEWWDKDKVNGRFYTTEGIADSILQVRKAPSLEYNGKRAYESDESYARRKDEGTS